MSIYLKSGYVDIRKILSYRMPFNFIIGGRGTGKTYGALRTAYEDGIRIMLLRRTQAQCDLINKPEFNPFKTVASDLNIDIRVKSISTYNSMIMEQLDEDREKIIGYTAALSTIANLRGFDASDVKLLIYDEFVPERHERSIKNEGSAFLNAYETINRNRELQGKDPLQVLCLANAFNISNAIFLELGLVGICEKMVQRGDEFLIDKKKGYTLVLLNNSRISHEKSDTALYRIAGGNYTSMAIGNDFVYNDRTGIRSMPLAEFRLICSIGEISIYKHKSKRQYYVSEHRTGSAPVFSSDEIDLKRYRKRFGITLYSAYMRERIVFETMLTKSLFELYTI